MKQTRKSLFFLFFVFLFLSSSYSEEPSISEKRKDILNYGIEPDIIALIDALLYEKEDEFDEDISKLFFLSKNIAIQQKIIVYFTATKNASLKEYCLSSLEDPWDLNSSIITALLSYAQELKISEAGPFIRNILDSPSNQYRDKAIQVLGQIGSVDDALFLVNYLDSDIDGSEKEILIVRQNIMMALGDLQAVELFDRFSEIALDSDENAIIRATAAKSIGKMNKTESLPVLDTLFESSDPILRTAAINGASNFPLDEKAQNLVLQGIRDSYYLVRLESIEAAEKMKMVNAVPYIIYRANNDPVEAIVTRSYDALGILNTQESLAWLLKKIDEEKISDKLKIKAIQVVSKVDPDSIYDKIVSNAKISLSDDKKTWLRYELGKIIITLADSRYDKIAELYLMHKDTSTRAIGIEMFNKNRYESIKSIVESIAEDPKAGALQNRAKKVLSTNP